MSTAPTVARARLEMAGLDVPDGSIEISGDDLQGRLVECPMDPSTGTEEEDGTAGDRPDRLRSRQGVETHLKTICLGGRLHHRGIHAVGLVIDDLARAIVEDEQVVNLPLDEIRADPERE